MIKFLKKCFEYAFDKTSQLFFRIKYRLIKKHIRVKEIKSIEDTIDKIIKENVSVSRFGDGEFKWILGVSQISFEKQSELLSRRLAQVLQSSQTNHIVCISPAINDLSYNTNNGKRYWEQMLGRCGIRLMRYLDINRIYYNANISRFYLNTKNKAIAEKRFDKIKKIWNQRNVLIIEGEYSRLGVGNDLFDNASSVRRILAPSKNAFESYNKIINTIKKNYNEMDLILIALGPTATVMAYDLSILNMQAIDIGHIDVEYEWFKMGATKKEAISGKAVNEVVLDRSHECIENLLLERYQKEIIDKVI